MRQSFAWEGSRPNCRLLIFTLELQQRSSSPSWKKLRRTLFILQDSRTDIYKKNIWIRYPCVYSAASTFGHLRPVISVLVISELYERSSVNYFKAKVLVWATGRQPRLILTGPTGQTLLIYWAITCWFVVMICFGGVLYQWGEGLRFCLEDVSCFTNSCRLVVRILLHHHFVRHERREDWCRGFASSGAGNTWRVSVFTGASLTLIKWDLIISSHFYFCRGKSSLLAANIYLNKLQQADENFSKWKIMPTQEEVTNQKNLDSKSNELLIF